MSDTNTVKLSPETIEILRVVSSINNSLKFTEGNSIKTVSPSGGIIFEAEVQENFPQDFAVYELNRLLSVLSMPTFKNACELVFKKDEHYMVIKSGSSKVKWFFSSEDFVSHPGKQIKLPKVDLEFEIQNSVLDDLKKATNPLNLKVVQLIVEDNRLSLVATDPSVDTSNNFVVDLGEVDVADGSYYAAINLDNLVLIDGDYTVQILKVPGKGIARFEHKTRKIVSFIALEKED